MAQSVLIQIWNLIRLVPEEKCWLPHPPAPFSSVPRQYIHQAHFLFLCP